MRMLLQPFGIELPGPSLSLEPLEAVLIAAFLGVFTYTYLQMFKHWHAWGGQKSQAQHEQEQDREVARVLRDIVLLLNPKPQSRKKLAPHRGDEEQAASVLEKPESLTWHQRARQLWLLRNRSYVFDPGRYDPAHNCWLGEEKNTGALALLACFHQTPTGQTLPELAAYARKVAKREQRTGIDLIVALKNDGSLSGKQYSDCKLTVTSEARLLEGLVDFSDYFDDIAYRAERNKQVDGELTLADSYTPSLYRREKAGEVQDATLEDAILAWLGDNTRRQLALLGEYGQGKSTGSLLLSHRLIREAGSELPARIPILIELRGKTLRTLSPEELLASWALHYRIDVQALLHLHMAGRLLLIFEGFDEIDLSGDIEARVGHFRTLWRFNYDQAKIIITGRPNFFLDSAELRRALGSGEDTQTLYLAPFDLPQIATALRAAEPGVCDEILALARRDAKFLEVVARPSLLYGVTVLWRSEGLGQRSNINSAVVIDLFIRQTLKRQQKKPNQPDEASFMVLNSAERHYFMAGVAAYMAAKGLPNQIDKQQLEEVVQLLVAVIPDAVSRSVSTLNNEDARPLRSEKRLEWGSQRVAIMDKIATDVRSCGLLVTDLSKDGAFKFAHKSYMELLQAQVIDGLFAEDGLEQRSGRSIANTWKLKIDSLQESDEAIAFLAELLSERLRRQGISEGAAIAKGLWETLVIGKLTPRHTTASLFKSIVVSAASRLAAWLVERFGVEREVMNKVGGSVLLLLGLFTLTLASVTVPAFLSGAPNAVVVAATVVAVFTFRRDSVGPITSAVGIAAMVLASFMVEALFVAKLVNLGWLWPAALLLAILYVLIGLYLGWLVGVAVDLLGAQRLRVSKRLRLWYRACQNLHLPVVDMEQTVGKGMLILLASLELQRGQRE